MAEIKGANRYDPEVLKLLRLIGTDNLMLQVIDMVLKAQVPQMEAELQNSGNSDFSIQEYFERIQQKVDIDSLLYEMIPIYNRYYTREEISGLIAFYETPFGRKLNSVLPQILQESMATFIEFGQAAMEKTLEQLS